MLVEVNGFSNVQDVIEHIASYLPTRDLCRAAGVSRNFQALWNDSCEWTRRLHSLPYSRITGSLGMFRFWWADDGFGNPHQRLDHPAVKNPKVYDRILSFLSSRDVEAVALADGVLRFVVYTHPQIPSVVRTARQRVLCIEHRQLTTKQELDQIDIKAAWANSQAFNQFNRFRYRFLCPAAWLAISVIVSRIFTHTILKSLVTSFVGPINSSIYNFTWIAISALGFKLSEQYSLRSPMFVAEVVRLIYRVKGRAELLFKKVRLVAYRCFKVTISSSFPKN